MESIYENVNRRDASNTPNVTTGENIYGNNITTSSFDGATVPKPPTAAKPNHIFTKGNKKQQNKAKPQKPIKFDYDNLRVVYPVNETDEPQEDYEVVDYEEKTSEDNAQSLARPMNVYADSPPNALRESDINVYREEIALPVRQQSVKRCSKCCCLPFVSLLFIVVIVHVVLLGLYWKKIEVLFLNNSPEIDQCDNSANNATIANRTADNDVASCPRMFTYKYNNWCYSFNKSSQTQPDAAKHCYLQEGTLLSINNNATFQFIKDEILGRDDKDSGKRIWTGLYDFGDWKKQEWRWPNGERPQFNLTNGALSERNETSDKLRCMVLKPNKWDWVRESCSYQGYFICQTPTV